VRQFDSAYFAEIRQSLATSEVCMSVPFTDAWLVSRYSNVYPPIGFRFVAIAVVRGTGERRGPVFENRDISAHGAAHPPYNDPSDGGLELRAACRKTYKALRSGRLAR